MEKPYIPFGEEWEKEIKKLSVRQLELVFDLEANGLKKSEFIEVIKKNIKPNHYVTSPNYQKTT